MCRKSILCSLAAIVILGASSCVAPVETKTPAVPTETKSATPPVERKSGTASSEKALEDCINVNPGQFARIWGGCKSEMILGIALDAESNIYAVGETGSFGKGGRDALILKYDANGDVQWVKTWGTVKWDFAFSVCVDACGDVYAVGFTEGSGAGRRDALLLKFSSTGSLIWARTWGGAKDDQLTAAAPAPNGGIYAAGGTFGFGAGDREAFILKCSSKGEIEWAKTWGGGGNDGAETIALDSGGNVYVAGYTFSFSNGWADAFVLKCDSSGSVHWARTSGGPGWDGLSGMAVDSEGNVYGVGQSSARATDNYDGLFVKYDASGSLLWARKWGTDYNDTLNAVAMDSSGNIYAAGCSGCPGCSWLGNILLLNYCGSGAVEQARAWGWDKRNQRGYGLGIDSRDDVFIGGACGGQMESWKAASGKETTLPWKADLPNGTQETVNGKTGAPDGTVTSPQGSHSPQGQDAIIIKNW